LAGTVALGLALLVLTGCAGTAASVAAPTTVVTAPTTVAPPTDTPAPLATAVSLDPCALISQQEADQLAGTPTASGVPSGPNGTSTLCMWTGDPSGPLGQVEVYVGDGAKKFLDIDKDTLHHPFAAVAGLGDEAWAEDNAIFFRKGDVWIGLHLVRLNDAAANAKPLETLARLIASRF
jgi:hypothetical protein